LIGQILGKIACDIGRAIIAQTLDLVDT